jgi:hypothetical protein
MAAVRRRRAAPQAKFATQADTMHVVQGADVQTADVDLLAIAGKPKFAPQRIVLVNTSLAAAEVPAVLVFTPAKGTNLTVTAQQGMSITIDHPVNALVDSGSSGTFEVHCYWWDAGTLDWNQDA